MFNKYLNNSLDNFINLEKLILNIYKKPLVNSLDKLTNLKYLTYNGNVEEIIKLIIKLKNLIEIKKCTFLSLLDKNKIEEFKTLHNLNVIVSINNFCMF